MKKHSLLVSLLLIGLCGVAQVNATPKKIDLAVKTYSTGYFHNGIRTVRAEPDTQYCALSTMTNFINLVASNYCTINVQNGVFVLTAYAAPNAGVNCSMTCFSSDSFNLVYR